MPTAKTRKFRPVVDRLESICLLSAGAHRPAMLHADQVIDLKSTPVAKDVVIAINSSTASFRRQGVSLDILRADSTNRTVSGAAKVTYKFGIFGSVTANIQFTTNVDNPRPADIKETVSSFSVFVPKSAKMKVARAVASVIRRDHDQIVATFPTA